MIIVRLKNDPSRENAALPEESYNTIGIVNWRLNMRPHLWRPPTDLLEMEDKYMVRVEVAGMQEADFNINIDQSILTITGNRPDTGERRAFHRMEIPFGEFITQIQLPTNIERDKVEAEYQDGFLRVIMPKAEPRQIKITKE